jgi:hypothetical protein
MCSGCASEKYARLLPDPDGHPACTFEKTMETIGGIVLLAGYVWLQLWASSHSHCAH